MKKLALVLSLGLFAATQTFAADCATRAPKGSRWAECTNARSNATVDQFMLTTDGDLYAYMKKNDLLCSVTNNVADMKTSRHPKDAAVLYFVRNGDLYVANQVSNRSGNCPEMSKKVLMTNVKKYNVVQNTKTTIVNTALDKGGNFLAWDNNRVVYKDILVKDYLLNKNYASEGKPFSSYVAFTLDISGYITKIEGRADNRYINNKSTNKRYNSIQDFKRDMNLSE